MRRKHTILLTIVLCLVLCVSALALTACNDGYGDWEITVNPTCTEPGELKRYKLKDKEQFETKEIPALGHLYDAGGGWEIIEPPTHASEGTKKRVCARCGAVEYQSIDILESAYTITIMDGDNLLEHVYIDEDGAYEITAPTKLGYTFAGFYDIDGKPFATSGTVASDATVYTRWNILPTYTFDELKERAAAGIDKILIGADITITDTVYFVDKTEVYITDDRTITRGAEFLGDMFVVGENTIVGGKRAELTLKTENGANLTIDGNKDNIESEVSGTAFLMVESCVVNMYDGVTVSNFKKTTNAKLLTGDYNISYPNKIGGAAMVVVNGTFNMYGGSFENNECNTDETNLGDDESDETRTSSCGGAIYNYATVNIYGGTFAGNAASRGGAIYNYRNLRVYAGIFRENYAGVYAGAVYLPSSQYAAAYFGNLDGDTDDSAVLFTKNTAEKSGGAMFGQMKNSIVVYGGTTFANNTARGNNGGAINTSGALLITGATFTQNTAASKGGAIYAYYSDEELTTRQVEISGSSFVGNTASKGGAIAFSSSSTEFDHGSIGSITGSNFSGNSAFATTTADPELPDESDSEEGEEKNYNGNGGAVYISRKSTVTIGGDCEFTDNHAERKGGAVYLTDAELTVDGAAFTSNSAEGNGGAIYCYKDSSADIGNATFSANTSDSADYGGGAMYFTGTTGTVTDCSFTGNKATGNNGGAIGAYGASDVTIDGETTFTGNTAAKNGGAVYIASDGTKVTVNVGSTFESNKAAKNGGAVCAYNASVVTVNGAAFTDNEAASESYGGGAVYFSGATATFTDCTFTGNKSTVMNGGAVGAYSQANVTFDGETKFINNTAAKNGGAVYIASDGTTVTVNGESTFDGNSAEGNGGAVYVTGKQSVITFNGATIFVGNSAVTYGGGIYATGASIVTVANVTATGNSAKNGGFLYFTTTDTVVTIMAGKAENNMATATNGGDTAFGNTTKAELHVTDKFIYPDGSINGKDGKYTLKVIEGENA